MQVRERPRSRMDKLGVRADSRVAVLGVRDPAFWRELLDRTRDVSRNRRPRDCDLVLLAATVKRQLGALHALERCIQRNGAIWVVMPRGRRELKEVDVIAAAKAAGLVDTKVVRFSDTHTALKLVIPLARR